MLLKPCDNDAAIEFVMSIRNDPETRKQFRRQHVITWADLVGAPNGGTRETFVAAVAGVNVGYVHIDELDDACELSWIMSPLHRGKGYGTQMVRAALPLIDCPTIIAEIKPGNAASIQIARRNGFKLAETHDGLLVWKRASVMLDDVNFPRTAIAP